MSKMSHHLGTFELEKLGSRIWTQDFQLLRVISQNPTTALEISIFLKK